MKRWRKVAVFTSYIWQINSTVVETKDHIYVFDPAYFPQEVEQIVRYVRDIRQERPVTLVFTHGDWDHIVGYKEFAEATVVAHEAIEEADRLSEQVQKAALFDGQYYIDRGHSLVVPKIDHPIPATQATDDPIAFLFADKGEIVEYLPTPGHTRDMMATYFPQEKVLVAGDMLSDREFPFIDDDSNAYLNSLLMLKRLVEAGKVELLVPGHGSCTTDPIEMKQRIKQDIDYIQEASGLVDSLLSQGQSRAEILPVFQKLRYKGKEIGPSLMGQHQSNLDQFIREANRLQFGRYE